MDIFMKQLSERNHGDGNFGESMPKSKSTVQRNNNLQLFKLGLRESTTSTPKQRSPSLMKLVIIKKNFLGGGDFSREGTKEAAIRRSLILQKLHMEETFFFHRQFKCIQSWNF
jgi:hypothetical protein